MITRIGIIIEEAVVEAEERIVRVVVAGIEIIVTEAEAAVGALITTKTVEGADMMMIDAVEVGLMEGSAFLVAHYSSFRDEFLLYELWLWSNDFL